jgi:hypothetical protein
MSPWPVVLGIAVVALVILDVEARRRGATDPWWRRIGSVLHAILKVAVIGLFALIALFLAFLVLIGPIGGP